MYRVEQRPLGNSGIEVPALSFGAGPVSGLMQSEDFDRQRETIRTAVDSGIDWFDSAPSYGDGRSESNLGARLSELGLLERVRIASKVRIDLDSPVPIAEQVQTIAASSLERLGVRRIALLQLHNAISEHSGKPAGAVELRHVFDRRGALDGMNECVKAGMAERLGLTGLGTPAALIEAAKSGMFASIQTPFHLLNPSAAMAAPAGFEETDHGRIIERCGALGVGTFAIRVFAGGATAGKPPSEHTHKTKHFPLDLYQRDCRRAARLARMLPRGLTLEEAAVRFSISHPMVSSAIVGFGSPEEATAAIEWSRRGPLPADAIESIAAIQAPVR